MKRIIGLFSLLISLSLACQAIIPVPATATPTPPPTATVTASPVPTATSTETPTVASQGPFAPADFLIRLHPDGGLFVGDRVSIEVIAPADLDRDAGYSVQITAPNGEMLAERDFLPFGIGGRSQATFEWTWDTSGVQAGAHDLEFTLLPEDLAWTHTIDLQPASELPAPEPQAEWARAESNCCLIYYLTGTAAERDLERLLASADAQAEDVVSFLEIDFTEPIEIVTMSRVIGHGGFASGDINITYMDRNYAGSDFDLVLHHEMVHILDARLGGGSRPSMFVEGLATYLTGGHFKSELLTPRAAALLILKDDQGSSWILPLDALADDFYNSQHEIGYLQAASLVEFMVESYGWEAFSEFYRDIQNVPGGKPSAAIDEALRAYFEISLSELEAQFVTILGAREVTQDHLDDVRLTVVFYDAVRRYQQALDPSAYFLSAWLPDGAAMRQYGIVADMLRQPSSVENMALETLLVAADEHLDAGQYLEADLALQAVDAVLDAMENLAQKPFDVHALAARHYQVVEWLWQKGYQAQRIQIEEGSIIVEVRGDAAQITVIELEGDISAWHIYGE
jgi:hypothetical protein